MEQIVYLHRAGSQAGLDRCAYLQIIANYFMRKLTEAEIARAKSHYELGTHSTDLIREWEQNGFPK